MRLYFLLAAVCVALVLPVEGQALPPRSYPELNRVATIFAMRDYKIQCAKPTEDGTLEYAWGYTYEFWDKAVVHQTLCDAMLAIARGQPAEDWKMAIGVLALVHEAYHGRLWYWRASEAHVQCKAIRHFKVGVQLLGGSKELADRLMGWALMFHWRVGALNPQYHLASCKVPNPY